MKYTLDKKEKKMNSTETIIRCAIATVLLICAYLIFILPYFYTKEIVKKETASKYLENDPSIGYSNLKNIPSSVKTKAVNKYPSGIIGKQDGYMNKNEVNINSITLTEANISFINSCKAKGMTGCYLNNTYISFYKP